MTLANKKSRETNLFSNDNIQKIKKLIRLEKQFAENANIFFEGDKSKNMYFLVSGRVKLMKTSEDGNELELCHVQANQIFGEMESFGSNTNFFDAVTLSECRIGVIHKNDLLSLLWQDKELFEEFLKWTAHMQQFIQYKLRDLLFHGKNGALASTLIRLANTYGKAENSSVVITKKFTNIQLANMIGTTRETVNRLLADFRKNKLIDQAHGIIIIHNKAGLKKICRCENCPLEICKI